MWRRPTSRVQFVAVSNVPGLRACLLPLLAAACLAGPARAGGEFSPPGLYTPQVYRLANGLQVVLRPRSGSRSVAIRVVVGVGMADYPCKKQETPHFLEHLLFTGTSRHSEEELEQRVAAHGGSWNAFTEDWRTVFHLDIFSGYAALGVETLHEILSDTRITDEKVELSRDVLLHEAGGAPTLLADLLDHTGVLQPASARAFNRLMSPRESVCMPEPLARDVSRGEIEVAYARFYVPANMHLILVGDFDPAALRPVIERSFGSMPAAEFTAPPRHAIPAHPGAFQVAGFDDPASVGFVFRVAGYSSPDYAGLWVLQRYLSQRLYQVLRTERGLTYSPSVSYEPQTDVGLFWISAEVEPDEADETQALIGAELDRIRARRVDLAELEEAREGALLSYAQDLESNADVADYYVTSLFELDAHGAFVDEEEVLKSLRAEDVLAAGVRAFAADRAVALRDRPFYFEEIVTGAAGTVALALVYVLLRLYRAARRRA